MPKEMDTAFYDRIHAYIPGWEFQKTSDAAYTDHFGVVTDFLSEVFRDLRKQSYADYAERYFAFGSHLGGRDQPRLPLHSSSPSCRRFWASRCSIVRSYSAR